LEQRSGRATAALDMLRGARDAKTEIQEAWNLPRLRFAQAAVPGSHAAADPVVPPGCRRGRPHAYRLGEDRLESVL